MKHLTTLIELRSADIERIFSITEDLKTKYEQGLREALLPGRVMALLFEKPSLRTRVSFEAGMGHLGGTSLFLGNDVGFGKRESIEDFGRVLSQYVDVMVVRTKDHARLLELMRHSNCPVINGLTDEAHPCQALADIYTLREMLGTLTGQKLAYIGDTNNVARSLAVGCGKVGMSLTVATPHGYGYPPKFLDQLQRELPDAQLTVTHDPAEAVRDAAAIYTDVWASMGQESQRTQRKQDFAAYQVNAKLISQAPRTAYFMHCLPARRGEEETDEVIDGATSIVVQQAANRLHVQKGILAWILAGQR
jgi:ornithine carbamoyltransferase